MQQHGSTSKTHKVGKVRHRLHLYDFIYIYDLEKQTGTGIHCIRIGGNGMEVF